MVSDLTLLKGTEGKIFIDNTWVKSVSGETINVINPANLEVIGTIGDADIEDIKRATDSAEKAFLSWSKRSARERADILYKAYHLMQTHKNELAKIITLENGKPLKESIGELNYAADFLLWYAEEAKRNYGETIPASQENKRIVVINQPVGIVGAITPWNFPAAMITRKVAPALAAGCTIIVKPATYTPLTAVALCQIFKEAGVPDGVVNLITTSSASKVSRNWMDDSRIRKVTFTGSTDVGKLLMREASQHVKKLSLELGGHAPLIVFDDADIEVAVLGTIHSKFRCGGQACIASNRLFVQEGIYDRFVERFKNEVRKMKVGNGLNDSIALDDGIALGPLIDEASYESVVAQINDAVSKGANVVEGGSPVKGLKGKFLQPTVIVDVTEEMDIMSEETFGPVAPIIRFESEEEVIRAANNTDFGLASYIFSTNLDRCIRVAEKLEFGIVGVNDGLPSAAQAPFGGMKESGIGREGCHHGMKEYLETKYISIGLKNT